MSFEAAELRALAAFGKERFPGVPIWIGGPHASVYYDLELPIGNIDAACIGEGEETFLEMVRRWLDDEPLDDVAGLALWRDGDVFMTPPRPPIADLDALPLPAWEFIDFRRYKSVDSMNGMVRAPIWSLMLTTRACPYRCVYCHSIFGKKVRKRSVEHVLREIEVLVREHGVREIQIADDIFNVDLGRAKAICDGIISRGLDIAISFPNGLRADRMDRELLRKLKAAGCYSITYGIETASPRLQKEIRKNLDIEKVRQVIEWTDEEKIIPQAFLMLGFPGETLEELRETIDFTLKSRILRPRYFAVTVFPRTELYEMARRKYPDFELSDDGDFSRYQFWPGESFYTQVTGIDLGRLQREAYRAFFLRPRIIWKILRRFPKNWSLFRGIFYGLRSILSQRGIKKGA